MTCVTDSSRNATDGTTAVATGAVGDIQASTSAVSDTTIFSPLVLEAAQHCRVVSIVGPTASGKTGLGIALAQRLAQKGQHAEIVNADAYQMYRGMDIGTAKASAQEQASVPHHLLDCISPLESMSVARYQTSVRECLSDLLSQQIRPIMVGGSGLYARAAIDDISFPGTDPQIRARLEEEGERLGPNLLFERLHELDPEAAQRMDARNIRRTIRALEVIEVTGKPYTASLPHYRYVIGSVQIGLDLPRETLDTLIDNRTQLMREAGFTEEVKRVRDQLGVTASRALGYQQIIDALDGLITEDEAYEQIAMRTKRLARKQMGWFGRDPRIHWLRADRDGLVERALAIVEAADRGDYDRTDSFADEYVTHHLGDIA